MTFRISGAKKVLDPYAGLRSDGESGVEFRSDRSDFIVEILLHSDDGGETCKKRELRFLGACSMRFDSFPGPVIPTGVDFDGVDISEMYGSLIEFEKSDLADAWTAHYAGRRRIRHFVIHFMAEKVSIGVLASGYEIGEAKPA